MVSILLILLNSLVIIPLSRYSCSLVAQPPFLLRMASSSEGVEGGMVDSSERVVDRLNSAAVSVSVQEKLESLRIVQEILVRKEPALLDNFLDEVMGFQKDRSKEVRKFVVGFIREACKHDPETIPKVIANLQMMLGDVTVDVQKEVILAMTHLYPEALSWLCRARTITDDMEAAWNMVHSIKEIIVHLLDADNAGIQTFTVKFMQRLVIAQTHKSPMALSSGGDKQQQLSASGSSSIDDFSLDDVPISFKFLRRRKLEEEAGRVFEDMVKYLESDHISSANLTTCMGALTDIASNRSQQFMYKVITAFEMLQANIPQALTKSQVSSVRNHLKRQLLKLLKHPVASEQFITNIATLLTDLGAKDEEVNRALPKFTEKMKRAQRALEKKKKAAEAAAGEATAAKRQKIDTADDEDEEDEEEEEEDEEETGRKGEPEKSSSASLETAVDITEKFILERMSPGLATELVIRSMSKLPRDIPPLFSNTYTPIAAAGTEGQVKHVSRLLATQLTAAKLGPGLDEVRRRNASAAAAAAEAAAREQEMSETAAKISTVVGGSVARSSADGQADAYKPPKQKVTLQPAGLFSKKAKARAVKLSEITHPMTEMERRDMMAGAIRRILTAGRTASKGGATDVWKKIITSLAAQFPSDMKSILLGYIFEDISGRADLAFSWLFEEYCFYQGFNRTATLLSKRNDDKEYNSILCSLIQGAIERSEGAEREVWLRRLYLEAPIITEDAIQLLKRFIQLRGTAIVVVNLMKDLVIRRPTKKLNFLNFLLEFCAHEVREVRETAIDTVLQLHSDGDFKDIIEDYSVMYLKFLLSASPPPMLFGEDRGRSTVASSWTEDITKVCLYLYLSLLPQNLKLFHHLAEVYVATTPEIKRTILRVLDASVRSIDINDPVLLEVIEGCPKGSETLVTRVIHILTEKDKPPQRLVDQVRDLYETRVSDVRFLIPVLNGLSKQEVTAALPKLIALSPVVVKEVFSRLLGGGDDGPMSPSDLLIALHNIDPAKCDMKTVIKATTMCFQDRKVFTQEVLSIVLQQLMEQTTIPLLFMRSVIQAVSLYPRMIGFVMNILQRLIVKQVWKEPRVWDGFIRCCERTVPQSYAVVLQLPPPQLKLFLDAVPKQREPLLLHVQNFNESQRAHVPASVMEVLYKEDELAVAMRQGKGAEPAAAVEVGAGDAEGPQRTVDKDGDGPPGE